MTTTLVFLAVLMAVFVTWLLRQSINVKPWVAVSEKAEHAAHLPSGFTAPWVGLGVFLAVVTSVFALSISAYLMRMGHGHHSDWQPLAEPGLLWLNTGILMLASVALQWAWSAAKQNQPGNLRLGLSAAGACTIAFIGSQYLVWMQLHAAGFYAAANPAYAFFYLLTALHAAHLLGGLVAWGRVMVRVWGGVRPAQVHESMGLCAVYWHFLLLVWAVLFGLVLAT